MSRIGSSKGISVANVYRKKFLISAGFVAFIQGAYKTSGFFRNIFRSFRSFISGSVIRGILRCSWFSITRVGHSKSYGVNAMSCDYQNGASDKVHVDEKAKVEASKRLEESWKAL